MDKIAEQTKLYRLFGDSDNCLAQDISILPPLCGLAKTSLKNCGL